MMKVELSASERYLREFQDRSEDRWFMLHEVLGERTRYTAPSLPILDEEDREDAQSFDSFMTREISLLHKAEDVARRFRGKLKDLHDKFNESAHEKETCIDADDWLLLFGD
jgi:hypothetical protein